jgi:hypothetical protein
MQDNYEKSTGVKESLTEREEKEAWDFLNACMQTQPFQYCFKYLVQKVPLLSGTLRVTI